MPAVDSAAGTAAIRFLRAHAEKYHIHFGKIGVWGSSAGGHGGWNEKTQPTNREALQQVKKFFDRHLQ